ncbi:MAG: hypothetical protein O7E52_03695, partial [Candidatus Poribacteria bacterium]|nr:hypothetical protein [Candidatus Poribacteria bacterium]
RSMHLRTLPDGQKVYSLIVLDGWSRVLVCEEVCLTKGARDIAKLNLPPGSVFLSDSRIEP